MPISNGKRTQLCWLCVHAVPNASLNHGCNWSCNGEPVEGWTAELRIMYEVNAGRRYSCKTYNVEECPQFKRG